MKRVAFIPLAAILLITAVVSCNKTTLPAPTAAAQNENTGPLAYIGARNWNTLFYFGTPTEFGCQAPCGFCHATPWQIGYQPNTNDPNNNEALTEISVSPDGVLLVSVDLNGVGNYYVNDIISSQHFRVAQFTAFPQNVIDDACDDAGIPHWGGPIGIAAGNYPVNVEATGGDIRLEIEGVVDGAGELSWTFFVR